MDKIDNLDKKILSILSQNARIPFKDVAAECNVSRAAIHQRVQHLIEGGVIMGSGFDVNPKSLGYSTCTYVGITLERGSMYKEVVECLQHIPEVVECHFTTGPYTIAVRKRRDVKNFPFFLLSKKSILTPLYRMKRSRKYSKNTPMKMARMVYSDERVKVSAI